MPWSVDSLVVNADDPLTPLALLAQAEREVLESQLEAVRLRSALERCGGRRLVLQRPRGLTPLAFPLWAESMRGQLSTEDWRTRVQRAAGQLEKRHAGRA